MIAQHSSFVPLDKRAEVLELAPRTRSDLSALATPEQRRRGRLSLRAVMCPTCRRHRTMDFPANWGPLDPFILCAGCVP